MTTLSERRCWQGLSRHHQDVKDLHLRDLFAADPARGERLVAEGAGLYLDYSKNRITDETIQLLGALAEQSGCRTGSRRCSPASGSTCPRTGRCCTWRCGCRAARR